jgi:hypothetical protein
VFISKTVYEANRDTQGDLPARRQMSSNPVFKFENHQSGEAMEPVYVAMKDRYGAIYKDQTTREIVAKAVPNDQKFQVSLTGTNSYVFKNGVAVLDNLVLTSQPSSEQTLVLSSESLTSSTQSILVSVKVRK